MYIYIWKAAATGCGYCGTLSLRLLSHTYIKLTVLLTTILSLNLKLKKINCNIVAKKCFYILIMISYKRTNVGYMDNLLLMNGKFVLKSNYSILTTVHIIFYQYFFLGACDLCQGQNSHYKKNYTRDS